jgi:Protein of unknown function (DUF3040)
VTAISMLNDRDRDLLKDLERQLAQEDPAWVHQFKDVKPRSRARRNVLAGTAIGLLLLSSSSVSCWAPPWRR